MPLEFIRDDDRRIVRLVATEPLGVDDVSEAIARQIAENAWSYGVLVDARRAALNSSEAGKLFAQIGPLVERHGPNGPVALVTRRPEGVGAAAMFSFRSGELALNVELFWDVTDAMEWLNARLKG